MSNRKQSGLWCGVVSGRRYASLLVGLLVVGVSAARTNADAVEQYVLSGSYELPVGSSAMDVLADGRVIALSGDQLYVETAAASRVFTLVGTLPAADISSYGVAFLAASPDGTRIAVGNNGGVSGADYRVGVFSFPSLSGVWFSSNHFTGTWMDATHLAIAAGDFTTGEVIALDVTSPDPANPIVVTILSGIGGASGGVAFDQFGSLYVGNGFMSTGPSSTGAVKAFSETAWRGAMNGGGPINYETAGDLVVDILSATSLGFDAEDNLHVAGGDFNISKVDFVALVRGPNVWNATHGGGSVDIADTTQVRRLDPDLANAFNFYGVVANKTTRELLLRSAGERTVYVYADPTPPVPTVSAWGLMGTALLGLIAGTLAFQRPSPGARPVFARQESASPYRGL